MPAPSVFTERRRELEAHEFQLGLEAGRLAVTLDVLTDALVLVGQHGVYCRSTRGPSKDLQLVHDGLEQAKELISSVLQQLTKRD